jgi:flavin-dependent dehydrogenase
MSTYDAIVIGAGVGGATAAISLAGRGARVLLVEAGAFPRHKVCGEFLSPESRAVLARVGVLEEIVRADAQEITRAQIVAPGGRILSIALPSPGLALSRFRLDELLWWRAQSAGVLCVSNQRVKSIAREGEEFLIVTGDETCRAKAALDATGRARLTHHFSDWPLSSARFMGFKAHFHNVQIETNLVELHFQRDVYCGIVRIEGGACNVCLLMRCDERDAKQNAPQRVWEKVLAQCPALRARLCDAERTTQWLATANVRFAARVPTDESGVLRLGDAAGYIHPLTGDGMAMAARSGELAAAIVGAQLRGSLSTRDVARLYQAAWHREFGVRLRWGDVLGKILLSPRSASLLLNVLTRMSPGAEMLLRATRGALPRELSSD